MTYPWCCSTTCSTLGSSCPGATMKRAGCCRTRTYSSGAISTWIVQPACEHSQIAGMGSLPMPSCSSSFAMFSLTSRKSASFRPTRSSQRPTADRGAGESRFGRHGPSSPWRVLRGTPPTGSAFVVPAVWFARLDGCVGRVWVALGLFGNLACWTNLQNDDVAVVLLHHLGPALRRRFMTGNVQEAPRVFPDLAVLLHRHLDNFTAGRVSAFADEGDPILDLRSFRGFADSLVRVPEDRVVPRDPFRTQSGRAVVCPVLLHQATVVKPRSQCALGLVCEPRRTTTQTSSRNSGPVRERRTLAVEASGISVFPAEIGCIVVLAGRVTDQVIRDLRQIQRARPHLRGRANRWEGANTGSTG